MVWVLELISSQFIMFSISGTLWLDDIFHTILPQEFNVILILKFRPKSIWKGLRAFEFVKLWNKLETVEKFI